MPSAPRYRGAPSRSLAPVVPCVRRRRRRRPLRWLSQSLAKQFQDLLARTGEPGSDGDATAQDYLEKIFQIPFSVAPLGLEDRARLVRGLLGPDDVPEPAATGPGDDPIDEPSKDAALSRDDMSERVDPTAKLPTIEAAEDLPGPLEGEATSRIEARPRIPGKLKSQRRRTVSRKPSISHPPACASPPLNGTSSSGFSPCSTRRRVASSDISTSTV